MASRGWNRSSDNRRFRPRIRIRIRGIVEEKFSLIFGEEFSLIFGEEFWGKVDSFSLFNEVKLSKRRGREGGLFILLGFSILLCELFLEFFESSCWKRVKKDCLSCDWEEFRANYSLISYLFFKSYWKKVEENFYSSQLYISSFDSDHYFFKSFPQSSWKRVMGSNIIIFSVQLLFKDLLFILWLGRISCQLFSNFVPIF